MAESLPELSVIVATRDRAERLAQCLAALDEAWAVVQVPWEVILVDNASTDHTAEVARDFALQASYPVIVLGEPRPGLSHARNAGAAASHSSWLAFTDDDCLVDPHWLRALRAAVAERPRLEVIGGRVDLADPRDLSTSTRLFPDAVEIADIDTLMGRMIGCNLAIRADLFQALGGFDPRLGAGTPAGSAEDLDLLYRALRGGAVMRYEPTVSLRHAHGRRGEVQKRKLAKAYTRGRGAFLAKQSLRGDSIMFRRFYWELRTPGEGRIWLLQGFFGRLFGR
jgi:glycosyltransferase involved in cell wall biosynthesis